jgi:hypothetical protein
MRRTTRIRKSFILLTFVAALGAPSTAIAYPIIGDDPGSPEAQAQGHAWYSARVKKAQQDKPLSKPNNKPKPTLCDEHGKKSCIKR